MYLPVGNSNFSTFITRLSKASIACVRILCAICWTWLGIWDSCNLSKLYLESVKCSINPILYPPWGPIFLARTIDTSVGCNCDTILWISDIMFNESLSVGRLPPTTVLSFLTKLGDLNKWWIAWTSTPELLIPASSKIFIALVGLYAPNLKGKVKGSFSKIAAWKPSGVAFNKFA